MRKILIFTWVFILIFAALPANSLADEPLIFSRSGDIAGLQFYFGHQGLPVDLHEIGFDEFNAEAVFIETSGDELAIIYAETKAYYYYGDYGAGTIYVYPTDGEPKEIDMLSANLAEYFIIQGSLNKAIESPFTVSAPKDTSLIFTALLSGSGNTVNFILVVQDGIVTYSGTY